VTVRVRLTCARAQSEGDVAPRVKMRRRGGQMQDDPAGGDDHVDAEFEQPLSQD
jgi:hypothetical protein